MYFNYDEPFENKDWMCQLLVPTATMSRYYISDGDTFLHHNICMQSSHIQKPLIKYNMSYQLHFIILIIHIIFTYRITYYIYV